MDKYLSKKDWDKLDELLRKHGFGGYYDFIEVLRMIGRDIASKRIDARALARFQEMRDKLSELRKQVESCKKCKLWERRNKPVFGEGPEHVEIMLVGLGPGFHEDLEGKPFVGAAGKLLDDLLELARLKRDDVYITNIMKCYLPDNKVADEEVRECTPYLNKQIEIIKPNTIVLLGNVATNYFFNRFGIQVALMRNLHGKVFSVSTLFSQIKIIPMYHPAAALRNPGLKDTVRNDWKNLL